MATFSVAFIAAATAALTPVAALGDGANVTTMEELAQQYEAFKRERASQRGSATARAQRERSRRAYAGQAAAEALGTALHAHRAFVAAPAWRPFTPPSGAKVEYVGDYAAAVELSDGRRVLVETTDPVRVEDGSGGLAPVDLSLLDRGSFFAPRNPLASLQLGKDAAQGALLPDIGLGVAPVAAPGAAPAIAASDKAFHGNVARDTDYLAIPVSGGMQAAWQLRSADSPEALELAFDLPAGAELRKATAAGEGPAPIDALEVVRGDERLATVSAPVAWDADDEPVPVSYGIEGDRLRVSVDHRSGDWHYPILVDPVVAEDQRYWRTNSAMDFNSWQYYENPADARWSYFYGDAYLGRGLYLHSRNLYYFNSVEGNAWYFQAPGDSHFYQAEFSYVQHEPDWQTLVSEGLWSPSAGGYQAGWASNQGDLNGTPNVSPISNMGPMGFISTMHCVTSSACDPSQGTSGNQVRLSLWTYGGGNRNGFTAYMGGAAGWLYDRNAPNFRVLSLTGIVEGDWHDEETFSASVSGRDGGLGIKYFRLNVPGYGDRYRTHPCAGHRLSRCSRDPVTVYSSSGTGDSFGVFDARQLPEGYPTVQGWVGDFAGNWSSPYQRTLKVDHSAPTTSFGGSLYDRRNQTVDHGVYKVRATGNDPYSGTTRVTVSVDGVELANVTQEPCDGCSLTAEATVQTYSLPPGEHNVVATATDALGHVSTSTGFRFFTPEGTPCPLNPFVDHPGVAQRPLGSLALCANWPLG